MPSNAERALAIALAVTLSACGGGRDRDRAPRLEPAYREQPGAYRPDAYQPGVQEPGDLPAEALPPGAPVPSGPRGTSQARPGAQRYDAVGYASWYGEEMGSSRTASGQPFNAAGISAAHPSLPMGSFAEVTALDTGKTILVIITDRGPNGPDRIIDLSRGAAEQLGIDRAGIAAVRVRLVDPPGFDQAALREGRSASPRIDTPPVLLAALRKRLPANRRAPAPVATRPPAGAPFRAPTPAPAPTRPAAGGPGLYVQVVALSARDRAEGLARSLGGSIVRAGAIYRVRLGPFADPGAAARARDDVARRGYGDARVIRE